MPGVNDQNELTKAILRIEQNWVGVNKCLEMQLQPNCSPIAGRMYVTVRKVGENIISNSHLNLVQIQSIRRFRLLSGVMVECGNSRNNAESCKPLTLV